MSMTTEEVERAIEKLMQLAVTMEKIDARQAQFSLDSGLPVELIVQANAIFQQAQLKAIDDYKTLKWQIVQNVAIPDLTIEKIDVVDTENGRALKLSGKNITIQLNATEPQLEMIKGIWLAQLQEAGWTPPRSGE